MEQLFTLILVGLTSVSTYLVGTRGFGLSGSGLRKAVGKVLECIGLTVVFFAFNVALGVIAILGTRLLLPRFVSLYLAGDGTLLLLSLLQALTFQWWHVLSKPSTG